MLPLLLFLAGMLAPGGVTATAAYHAQVWSWLQRRGLSSDEVEDLLQETFLALHSKLLEHGFPDSLAAMLRVITAGKASRRPQRLGVKGGHLRERTGGLKDRAQCTLN